MMFLDGYGWVVSFLPSINPPKTWAADLDPAPGFAAPRRNELLAQECMGHKKDHWILGMILGIIPLINLNYPM